MKNQKRDGDGAGLQDWLSYQARTAAVAQRETDVVDWDEGIEVQEEWLPRELCEQRLREESERVPESNGAACEITPVIELQNVPLEYFAPPESKDKKAAEALLEDAELDITGIEVIESELAEADLAFDVAASDLTPDLPAEVIAVTIDPPAVPAREFTVADLIEPTQAQEMPAEVAAVTIDSQAAPAREITLADLVEPANTQQVVPADVAAVAIDSQAASAREITLADLIEPKAAPAVIEAPEMAMSIGCSEPALQT